MGTHRDDHNAALPGPIYRHVPSRNASIQPGEVRAARELGPGDELPRCAFGGVELGKERCHRSSRLLKSFNSECGGAPLKKADLEKLMSRAPWRLIQAYGMTEAAGYVAYQTFDENLPDGCTGNMLPGIEARLMVEGKNEEAPEGGPGELWLRGPNITSGYVFNEEANQKAFPEPGWYNTGDVCKIDSQGQLFIVGRTKDLIKYKGFQVSPQELESYLNSHPLVAEAGVAALWDESQLTELPTAWVILKPDSAKGNSKERTNALKIIQKAIDSQVSGYKKLRGGVWEVSRLPKNATGKILRKEMAEMRAGLCSIDETIYSKL
ncbi:hypothetical protein V2G26_012983 [Clonostachys chloroleuca]